MLLIVLWVWLDWGVLDVGWAIFVSHDLFLLTGHFIWYGFTDKKGKDMAYYIIMVCVKSWDFVVCEDDFCVWYYFVYYFFPFSTFTVFVWQNKKKTQTALVLIDCLWVYFWLFQGVCRCIWVSGWCVFWQSLQPYNFPRFDKCIRNLHLLVFLDHLRGVVFV